MCPQNAPQRVTRGKPNRTDSQAQERKGMTDQTAALSLTADAPNHVINRRVPL